MKKKLFIILAVSALTSILFFSTKAIASDNVNCTGYDGATVFYCVGEGNRVCSSIIINGVPVVQCRGEKKARPTEANPNL